MISSTGNMYWDTLGPKLSGPLGDPDYPKPDYRVTTVLGICSTTANEVQERLYFIRSKQKNKFLYNSLVAVLTNCTAVRGKCSANFDEI